MQLEFIVDGQTLKRNPTDKQIPVANSRGYLKAHFALTEEFKGLVSAYFKIYQDEIPQGEPMPLDDDFICSVPDGVIKSGILYVSLSCTDESLYIPTNDVLVPIPASGVPTEILQEPDGTVNEYEDFQRMYNEILSMGGNTGGGTIGVNGKSIEYIWQGTSLGIRREGETTYQFSNLKGAKGDTGDTGDTGIQGPKGNDGNQGPKGDTGEKGEQGIQGLKGEKGETGLTGLKGDDGNDGYTPVRGVDYFTASDVNNIVTSIMDSLSTINIPEPTPAISNVYTIDFQNKTSINKSITTSDTVAKTLTVTNVLIWAEMYLELTYAQASAITWFSGITWQSGSAPILTVGKTYRMAFFTSNSGTTWHGICVGGW